MALLPFLAFSEPRPKASIGLVGPEMTNLGVQSGPLSSAHQRLDNFPDSYPLESGHLYGLNTTQEPLLTLGVATWRA